MSRPGSSIYVIAIIVMGTFAGMKYTSLKIPENKSLSLQTLIFTAISTVFIQIFFKIKEDLPPGSIYKDDFASMKHLYC